jgi:hypothetical protein
MKALIAVVVLLATPIRSDAADWARADLYFRGWFTERAVAVTPEGLREEAHQGFSRAAHIASALQLQQLVAVLDLPRLHRVRCDPRSDTTLVVDLFDSSGVRTTYRAGDHYLWSADCTRGREVDDHFRQFFERLMPERPNHAMEPTTGRRTPKFSLTRTSHPAATRALASGGSSCSR